MSLLLPKLVWNKICAYLKGENLSFRDLVYREKGFPSDDVFHLSHGEFRHFKWDQILLKIQNDSKSYLEAINSVDQIINLELIYNHDLVASTNCIHFNRLYRYKCYYIRFNGWDQNIYRIDELLNLFNSFKVIHQVAFDYRECFLLEKTLEQKAEIFHKLSNKENFLEYMSQIYDTAIRDF